MSGAEVVLPRFDADRHCPKCDGAAIHVIHHPANTYTSEHACAAVNLLVTSYPPEHLCVRCERCSYRWATKTEDTP